MSEVIVARAGKATSEGIVLETNIPARSKGGSLMCKEHWFSWDAIGEAMFDNYTQRVGVDERDELRGKK